VKCAKTGPVRSPDQMKSCPNINPASKADNVQGKYRRPGPMCRNEKTTLETKRPQAGSIAARKKISSPTDDAPARMRISESGSGPRRARKSRCSERASSKRCAAKRDTNTIPRPIVTPISAPSQGLGDGWLASRQKSGCPRRTDQTTPADPRPRYSTNTSAARESRDTGGAMGQGSQVVAPCPIPRAANCIRGVGLLVSAPC